MHFKLIWERILHMLLSPKAAWKQMKTESGCAFETILFLFVCCTLLGFSSLLSDHEESWAPETFIFFSSLLLMSVLIRALSPKMRKVNWEGSLNLLVYSIYPALLLYALSLLIGYRIYLLPTALVYSLVLYCFGLQSLLSMSWKESLLYTLVSFFVFAICLYWGRIFLSV